MMVILTTAIFWQVVIPIIGLSKKLISWKTGLIKEEGKETHKATEKAGNVIADRKEDEAKQLRKDAESQADTIKDDADRIRKD